MKDNKKPLWRLLGLIAVACAVLAYVAAESNVFAELVKPQLRPAGPVTMQAHLVQDKVLTGSQGEVAVALTLSADRMPAQPDAPERATDLVIVLDRSGSMQGQKLSDARQAVLRLVDRLTARDRLALVTYSNGVESVLPLVSMDADHRQQAKAAVREIFAGGGTNLGGGLQYGIDTLLHTVADGRQRKMILISDGLANQGITDPLALGRMASSATARGFTISAVGVGYDFNEVLMTTIADHGAGRYYFLENPNAFAQVFEKEFTATRNVAASGLTIRVPLNNGVRLVDAGGYPVEVANGVAVVHPGDLVAGQERKLFLTFNVPTDQARRIDLGRIDLSYTHQGAHHELGSRENLTLACVADQKEVLASIDETGWAAQVVQEDYSRLREGVADAIRKGEKTQALEQIHEYETRNRSINAAVGSAVVADNLDKDLEQLRQSVENTFAGPPAAVAEKRKQESKALQYESYKVRRDKK